MAKPRTSQPESQKEVYKFWLGFFEKITLLVAGVAFLPQITGQLQYSSGLLILASIIILVFVAVMINISWKLWYLPKDQQKEEVKNDSP